MGPFRMRADLDIQVRDVVEGRSLSLRAEGEDRQVASRIAVDATLRIDDEPQVGNEGATVAVEGTYEVTGKIATLGASMIRSKAPKRGEPCHRLQPRHWRETYRVSPSRDRSRRPHFQPYPRQERGILRTQFLQLGAER